MAPLTTCSLLAGAMVSLCIVNSGSAEFEFVEAAAPRGIGPYQMAAGMGGGLSAADYDNDGDIDVFIPTAQGFPNQLYRNAGDGVFEDVALDVGLASTLSFRSALWIDIDGDGDLDLALAADACSTNCVQDRMLALYEQVDTGVFQDITATSGLDGVVITLDGMHVGGMAAADVDNDGDLDLYVCYWEGHAYLFHNDGTGYFDDASVSSGLSAHRPHWQPLFHDIDGDGWTDLFQAIDFEANLLWINNQDGTFTERAAEAGVDNAFNDMGAAFGDYDNDGDFDLYVANASYNDKHSVFYRNDSSPGSIAYTELSQDLDVDQGYWGWGTTFLDADRDGWLDLAATNGACCGPWANDPSRFWRGTGGPQFGFEDIAGSVGFDDTEWGSGLIGFDMDRDGDADLMQTCQDGIVRLLVNESMTTGAIEHSLTVRPRMTEGNTHGIGAIVRITIGDTQQSRLISAGTSFLSQEPAEAFFGLGFSDRVDEVRVEWPANGGITKVYGVAADQVLDVWKPVCRGDRTRNGSVGLDDLLDLFNTPGANIVPLARDILGAWGPCLP